MKTMLYVNGTRVSEVIGGCEYVGAAWVKAQKLAELLGVSCTLVNANTCEAIARWEP